MATSIQGTFDEGTGDGRRGRPSPKESALASATHGDGEQGFSGPNVCEIVDITYRQLDYWDRTHLLKPSVATAHGSGTQRRYSYRDLVQLKVIKGLLDAGVRLQTARTVIESLRDELGGDWQTASLVIDGANTVLAKDGEHLVDLVRRGQGVLNVVPVHNMVEELDAAILRLAPRDAGTSEVTAREQRAAEGG